MIQHENEFAHVGCESPVNPENYHCVTSGRRPCDSYSVQCSNNKYKYNLKCLVACSLSDRCFADVYTALSILLACLLLLGIA